MGQHVEVNLLSSALSGLVNQTGAFTAAGVVPHRMGNAHPSVYPYQTMPTRRPRRDHHRRQRPPVPVAVRGARHRRGRRRPALPAQRRPHRATATSCTRLLRRTSSPSGRPTTCSSRSTRPACRAARSTRSARASSSPSGSGSTRVVTRRRGRPGGRPRAQPDHVQRRATSATTCRRPSSASTATRSAAGSPIRLTDPDGRRPRWPSRTDVPHRHRRVRRRHDHAARPRPRRRPARQDHASASSPTGW